MKIAISASGPSLDAEVDPRFGRCQYLIIVDPDTMEFEAVENSNAMAAGGAGIATGQMIAEKGVNVVLTGNCTTKPCCRAKIFVNKMHKTIANKGLRWYGKQHECRCCTDAG